MPEFTISCSTAKWNEVKPFILLAAPNSGEGGLSDNDWIKKTFLSKVQDLVITGKQIARQQAQTVIDDDAFTIE